MTEKLQGSRLLSVAWAFYMLLAVGGVLWLGWREELEWSTLTTLDGLLRDLGLGATAGLVLLGVWELARRGLPRAQELEVELRGMLGYLQRDEIVALAVISGVAEEVFFRGGVQGSWGWLWATVLFGLLHTGPGRVFRLWTLFALVAGALFGGLRELTGGLLAPVVAHVFVNGVNLWRMMDQAAEVEPLDRS